MHILKFIQSNTLQKTINLLSQRTFAVTSTANVVLLHRRQFGLLTLTHQLLVYVVVFIEPGAKCNFVHVRPVAYHPVTDAFERDLRRLLVGMAEESGGNAAESHAPQLVLPHHLQAARVGSRSKFNPCMLFCGPTAWITCFAGNL